MKKLIFTLSLLPLLAEAQIIPESTIARLQKLYPDQTPEFIQDRINNAPTAFNKWRSFPPYYYEMVKRSVNNSTFSSRQGLCAGDAHLENFGFIANGTSPIFTINDMDDITTCSLNADLMRLFVGQRLLLPDLKAETFLTQYQNGLKGQNCPQPSFIKYLSEESIRKGRKLSKKNKAILDEKSCKGDYSPLSDAEKLMLEAFVKKENAAQMLHACARIKNSGGSAGSNRYIIFRKTLVGVTDAFEIKQLKKAAPDFEQTFSNEDREQKFKQAVNTYLSAEMSEYYYPVTINETLYQRRSVWAGDEAVKEADVETYELFSQKEVVMLYEACKLGGLHAKSNSGPVELSSSEWEKTAQSIEGQFRKEFGQE